MNYIETINNFWSHTEEEDLTSGDTSVYFALLKYNNSLNWIKTFRCDYAVICQYARVSKNTFYKSLDRLQDLNLITYQKGERNRLKPKITVLKLKNKKGTIKEQEGNSKGTQEEHEGNLYKPINIKTIKPIKKESFNFRKEMINSGFREDLVLDWLAVRKTKKATNTKTALNGFLNQVKKTGKDQNIVLEHCINKSWSGFKAVWLEKEENDEKSGNGNSAVDNLKKAMGY
jgi:DNA-binding PadR family transcriptional regulator